MIGHAKTDVHGPPNLVTAPHNQIVTLTQNSLGLEERVLAFTLRKLSCKVNPLFAFDWYLKLPSGCALPDVNSQGEPVQAIFSNKNNDKGNAASGSSIEDVNSRVAERERYIKLRRFVPATGETLTSPIIGGYVDLVEVAFHQWPLRADWIGAIHNTNVQLKNLGDSILASTPATVGQVRRYTQRKLWMHRSFAYSLKLKFNVNSEVHFQWPSELVFGGMEHFPS